MLGGGGGLCVHILFMHSRRTERQMADCKYTPCASARDSVSEEYQGYGDSSKRAEHAVRRNRRSQSQYIFWIDLVWRNMQSPFLNSTPNVVHC
jgi:hypothetical protein